MHNCKLTRNALTDSALGELSPAQTNSLLAELNNCAPCQAEYAALRNTLRVSSQALQSTLPSEDFWSGYHSRLQDKLSQHVQREDQAAFVAAPSSMSFSHRILTGLRMITTASVRVPMPAAFALILLAGVFFFMQRGRGEANVTNPAATFPVAHQIETKTIEVPVVHEKVVTQVVYRERKSRRQNGAQVRVEPCDAASASSDPSTKTAMSLVGFKPTEQVNLKVIKGNY